MSASLVRAGYWFAYHTVGYPGLRVALARSTLVLYDRHFVDILVDPTRYRYGGPMWLMRLIWQMTPKPDLILLLDAPAEVLQARKQEVPLAVTARQRNAYSVLVRGLTNGRIVDAARPFEAVANDAMQVILDGLAARNNRYFRPRRTEKAFCSEALLGPSPRAGPT
jgi:thymidylate kinase